MNCSKCETEAPSNISLFPGNVYTCGECLKKNKNIAHELADIYMLGFPGRYLYISELTNNLDKVQNYLIETIPMDHPFCTITLVEPAGLSHVTGAFDIVYIDQNAVSPAEVEHIELAEHGVVKYVNPTTQELL